MSTLDPPRRAFYRRAIRVMKRFGPPFVVGGAYAQERLTGVSRDTKDLDLFVAPRDVDAALAVFRGQGLRAERTYPHWLAKVHEDGTFVDIIFRSGNGLAEVDAQWFERSVAGTMFGLPVRICSAEDMIWSKAFVMERERFDGADIAHLFRACGPHLDWKLLLSLFGPYWRVLAAHVILFGFVYPGEGDCIPGWVLPELLRRLEQETDVPPAEGKRVCQGTLLSRAQYLVDVNYWGYADARIVPRGRMSAADVAAWTAAIDCDEVPPQTPGAPRGARG